MARLSALATTGLFALAATASSSSSSFSAGDKESSGFVAFLVFLFNAGLVIGPQIGYVLQYFDIYTTGNVSGYSPIVSLILLTSNTVRVFYYPGAHFAVALLLQAIVAAVVHCVLLHRVLCVGQQQKREAMENRVLDYLSAGVQTTATTTAIPRSANDNNSRGGGGGKPDPTTGLVDGPGATSYNVDLGASASGPISSAADGQQQQDINFEVFGSGETAQAISRNRVWQGFMRGTYAINDAIEARFELLEPQQFVMYYAAAAVFGFIGCLVLYAVTSSAAGLVATVGYIALSIEATFLIPQILRNARRRSTEGLTVFLIFAWALGDVAKLAYFFAAGQPLPFVLCGFVQLALDFVVLFQFFMYRGNRGGGGGAGSGDAGMGAPDVVYASV